MVADRIEERRDHEGHKAGPHPLGEVEDLFEAWHAGGEALHGPGTLEARDQQHEEQDEPGDAQLGGVLEEHVVDDHPRRASLLV